MSPLYVQIPFYALKHLVQLHGEQTSVFPN